MITEEQAREAAKSIPAIALLEMSPPVCDVLKWAACDLSRRESERAERAKPKWQGEPDSEGEHYVEGIERVCWVFRDDGGSAWAVEYVRTNPATGVSELTWEPLNGRRVCPVGCRPKGGA